MAHETDHFLQLLEVQWHMSDDDFHFDIDRVRSPFSKAQLIASLKKYAQLHSVDTFGMREYDVWDGKAAHSETIRVRFGTWVKLFRLLAVGLSVAANLTQRPWSKRFVTVGVNKSQCPRFANSKNSLITQIPISH